MKSVSRSTLRFWKKVSIPENSYDCWIWTGGQDGGRPKFWYKNKNNFADTLVWEWYKLEKVPKGKYIKHVCGNKLCINPDHLLLGNKSDWVIKDVNERFWSYIDKKSDEECWEWQGSRDKSGYGYFWDGKSRTKSHRYSWILHNDKEIPEGMYICHHCDNPPCCNPKHLFLGTPKDNVVDFKNKLKNGTIKWM